MNKWLLGVVCLIALSHCYAENYGVIEIKSSGGKASYYAGNNKVIFSEIPTYLRQKKKNENLEGKEMNVAVLIDSKITFYDLNNFQGLIDKLGRYNTFYFLRSTSDNGSLYEFSIQYNKVERKHLDEFFKQKEQQQSE